MLSKTNLHIFSPIIVLLLLSSCGQKPTYKLTPLEPKTSYDQVSKTTETGDVIIRCSTCSRQYIRELFGKQSDTLLGLRSRKRIVPVQLYIENNSDYTWSLSPFDIHIPLADVEIVKARFTKAATKKGLASLGSHACFGLLCVSVGTAASLLNPILGASIFGVGCSMLITAPIFSHNKAASVAEQNARYAYTLDNLTLTHDTLIHPHERVNKLIFVQQYNMSDRCAMRLCNAANPDHTMLYQLYIDSRVRKT